MLDTPIERFAALIIGKPLYSYQVEPALAILDSIEHNRGHIITVMMARQSGKNQLSAIIEAFLLCTRRGGVIIKAAPTFNPQILNSRRRLMSMLENEYCRARVWTTYGTIGLSPSSHRLSIKHHSGPSVQFFSADPESNVVGATADILLEIDEAQDVSPEKFDKDFRPMAATTNATTVMYGTEWDDETLLARQVAVNKELFEQTGERRHFEYDWRYCGAANPNYKKFVEEEIKRLGEDHIAIQTQYFLRPISGAGHFLNDLQRSLLRGVHIYEGLPGDGVYVAGLDVGGEARVDPSDPTKANVKRDSTVLTIGRVFYNALGLPVIIVMHHEWWTGMHYLEQYAHITALMEEWSIRRLCIDNTGIGAGLASLLLEKFGEDRVALYNFTRPSKSKLGYQVLALINSGRLKSYAREGAPQNIYNELWKQLKIARYRLPGPEIIDFYVEPGEGHDDFLMSLALLTEALQGFLQPAEEAVVKPYVWYQGESRF